VTTEYNETGTFTATLWTPFYTCDKNMGGVQITRTSHNSRRYWDTKDRESRVYDSVGGPDKIDYPFCSVADEDDFWDEMDEELEEVCWEIERLTDEILLKQAIRSVDADTHPCPPSDFEDEEEDEMHEVCDEVQFKWDMYLFLKETGQLDDAE